MGLWLVLVGIGLIGAACWIYVSLSNYSFETTQHWQTHCGLSSTMCFCHLQCHVVKMHLKQGAPAFPTNCTRYEAGMFFSTHTYSYYSWAVPRVIRKGCMRWSHAEVWSLYLPYQVWWCGAFCVRRLTLVQNHYFIKTAVQGSRILNKNWAMAQLTSSSISLHCLLPQ